MNTLQAALHKPTPKLIHDTEMQAPGLDLSVLGKTGFVRFSGHFYAMPDKPFVKFSRPVQIIFASPEILVALDLQLHSLYVIDRAKSLSLGCRMTAHFKEQAFGQKVQPVGDALEDPQYQAAD